MKRFAFLLVLVCTSCAELFSTGDTPGTISIFFRDTQVFSTRSEDSVPDIDDFLLSVVSSDGKTLYGGRFADSPERMEVPPGSYTVSAYSCEFGQACYSSPQYGDSKVVNVASSQNVSVALECSQTNAGVRLSFSPDFRTRFPASVFYIDGVGGRLMWNYGEERTAYFKPGKLVVTMVDGESEQMLFSRILEPRQILSVEMTASSETASEGISIQLDTNCTRLSEHLEYGSADMSAYSVQEARDMAPLENVWVYGYIAGSFSSSSKCEFEPPFSKNTNIVIASRTSANDKSLCISVELKSAELKSSVNLQDHPELLGRKIVLRGDLVTAYYGITGLKNVSEFHLE